MMASSLKGELTVIDSKEKPKESLFDMAGPESTGVNEFDFIQVTFCSAHLIFGIIFCFY
jgi:hypothetical protein